LLGLLLLPSMLVAQQSSADPPRRGSDPARRASEQARRDSLEMEVAQKFLEQLTRELKLDAAQRSQTERVLKESGDRRRELMRVSGELRGQMYRALRDRGTDDAAFTKLLTEYDQLRVREHDLWRRDQEELARYLTPRQRTQFLIEWGRFQERVRAIMEQRMQEQRGARPPH
jgi:Spy/CpxP family protein refolding chaperone